MKRIIIDTNFYTAFKRNDLEAMNLLKRAENAVYDDLDHLAGTWSARDAAEFEAATAVFEKVDENMWK